MMTKEFRKLNNLIGWIVFAVATFTYCATIEPTASFWDCGEYIACAYKLEVGHPPGAPFFLLVGRFFTLFGGSDPANAAMMINIMSALSSSFSILFLFWTITRLGIKVYGKKTEDLSKPQQWAVLGAGIIGGLAYTFSDSFWFSAVEGEVYAMSSFFTAVVFWAILKWDEEDSVDPTSALRWLVLIAYLVGLSIGVHLLNLLVIPAIGFIIYFKKYTFTWKSFFIAGFISVVVLGFVQSMLVPKFVKFLSDYEVFFTNKFHLPFSTGTIIFFLLLIVTLVYFILYTTNKNEKHYKIGYIGFFAFTAFAAISAESGSEMFWRVVFMSGIYAVIHKFKTKTVALNAIFLSFTTLLIGFSSFFVLVIRSQANTPMDENDPENAPNMLSYLLREQYGDWPILYGQYYNAPTVSRSKFEDGTPIYAKDEAKKNYRLVDARKKIIPKYEKDFCTPFPRMYSRQPHHETGYKYWGNVAENRRNKVIQNYYGESETVEIPTMAANLTFFFRYQINYMYLRYFYWNFVGRQNDIQGSTGNNMEGNWITGIKAIDNFRLDYDTTNPIYRDKNNFANNHFYALPLILGLFGMFFHFKRNKPDAWVVLCFFLLTGLAIVVYLNQSPYQPRERDYAYAGSFYAFAIWIGLGVMAIFDFLSKKSKSATMGLAIGSTALCLVVPGIMAQQGWDDHNRSLRTLSRDCAIDYLESCAPNAILFTNGDNDTFPLWYAQEVEGIRTDVRVVNLSLLQTDWYYKQMCRAAYESAPVPFTIPLEKVEASKLEYVVINRQNKQRMDLQEALAYVTSNDVNTKYDAGNGELIDILPTNKFVVNIDSAQVAKSKVLNEKDMSRLSKQIEWDLGGRNHILKNDLLVLDLIANNDWSRPIYFAVTTGDEAYVGLKDYFQLEGLAYRFVPVKQGEMEAATGGRVNTDVMYDNIMNKFLWGGMDKKGVNLDENCTRMTGNLRMQMSILAGALINEGKNDKAKAVLDKCIAMMPDENIPFDVTLFSICGSYYEINDFENANKLAKKLFDIFEGDLRIYSAQKPNRRAAYGRDINQAKEILRRLTSLAHQFKQEDLAKEFMDRIQRVLSAEDLAPITEPQMP
ncbi:MAG: DUF2723 domain-containing protein [Bacteroidetes bacterium]|nr:DUF2723 domain-containing protein [Bacteroidota bacterium]